MKQYSYLLMMICLVVFYSCNGQKSSAKHTDHMGMRALTTKHDNEDLGCKNGHLWKRTGDDDWVDVGPVTDSCNCDYHPDPNEEPFHAPGKQKIAYVVIAVGDSSIYWPTGFGIQFLEPNDSLPAIKEIRRVPADGMGILMPVKYPCQLVLKGFRITISKNDKIWGDESWMFTTDVKK